MSDKQPRKPKSTRSPRRANGGTARLPIVTPQKQSEYRSRQLFEAALHPWLLQDRRHDNGIDCLVEITRPGLGDAREATGKHFLVQLKSTEARVAPGRPVPARIRPMHVRYWSENNLPVLLAMCHLPSERFWWRWVDDSLLAEIGQRDPAWMVKDSLTVHLPFDSALDPAGLSEIERFVMLHRHVARRILAPGQYLALHTRALEIGRELDTLAQRAKLAHVQRRLADLQTTLRGCTYVVALTGPARAGKSTLLNALLHRDLSPVDCFPTTAVPIMVGGGAEESAEVTFTDGTTKTGPAESDFIAEFATQDRNPDNSQGVRMVSVRLVNDMLDRGVALIDSPGLHDPSEAMRELAAFALESAHAILYVLDVSPARNGGFSLNVQTIADLDHLKSQAERLIVILNKADDLGRETQDATSAYVERELRKYGLWDALPVKPLMFSAKSARDHDCNATERPLQSLHEALWGHLLKTRSTGLDRLAIALRETARSAEDMLALIASRGADAERSQQIRVALAACRTGQTTIADRCRRARVREARATTAFLADRRASAMAATRTWLDSIPLDSQLPTREQLRGHLQMLLARALASAWSEANTRAQAFAADIAGEVEICLERSRVAAGSMPRIRFVIPALGGIEGVAVEPYREAWAGFALGSLAALLLQAPAGLLLSLVGWAIGHKLGEGQRRKREIEHIMQRADGVLGTGVESIRQQIVDRVHAHIHQLEGRSVERIGLFVKDTELQLRSVEANGPTVSKEELDAIAVESQRLHRELQSVALDVGPASD